MFGDDSFSSKTIINKRFAKLENVDFYKAKWRFRRS